MKITKKQLDVLIQESVKRIVHEMVSGKGYVQTTMHGLEIGPVQVSARVIPGRKGTFMSPEEPEEIEVDEFSFQDQSISMDELLERENQIRMELGEPALSHEELLQKAELAVAENSIDYADSHDDDLYDLYIGK
jgi:hypothetical protein